jgi:hypothetical protein
VLLDECHRSDSDAISPPGFDQKKISSHGHYFTHKALQDATTISGEQHDRLPLVQQGRIRSSAAFAYLAP